MLPIQLDAVLFSQNIENFLTSYRSVFNAKNTLNTKKIALDTKVDSKADILFIVDEGMARIPKGPEMNDHRGRAPGHPHYGHNH